MAALLPAGNRRVVEVSVFETKAWARRHATWTRCNRSLALTGEAGEETPWTTILTATGDLSRPTLERWLTGPRFSALPARGAAQPPPLLSFEFFPPKTDALENQLWSCIRRLEPLRPRFVSVTYGAGGSTRLRTHATVARIVRETAPGSGGTPDLRGREPRRGGRRGATILASRCAPYRRAARRCPARCGLCATPRTATPSPPTSSPG